MNDARRKMIAEVIETISSIRDELVFIYDEETDAMDRMPESLSTSLRMDEMDSIASRIDNAVGSLEDIIDDLQEIVDTKMTAY